MTTNVGVSRRPSRKRAGQSGVVRCSTRSSQILSHLISSRSTKSCSSIRAGRSPTASVDAALQNSSALCSRARMFMLHALYLLRRGFEYFSDGILDVRLARWFLSSLCVVFVRAFLCRATVCVGGCRVGPAWVSDAESLPWIPRK